MMVDNPNGHWRNLDDLHNYDSFQALYDEYMGDDKLALWIPFLFAPSKYNVWKVVDRTPGHWVLKARWVYTRKIDGTTGKPAAYKPRWFAKGFSPKAGINYNEVFSAVAHKDSIRVFLSLVNHLDMECDQVDIKAAFLNGDLKEIPSLSSRGFPQCLAKLWWCCYTSLQPSPRYPPLSPWPWNHSSLLCCLSWVPFPLTSWWAQIPHKWSGQFY